MWLIKNIKEFCNTSEEFHALIIGFFEPWTWIWRQRIPQETMKVIEKEFHYYRLGKAIGGTLLIITVFLAGILIRRFL